MVDSSVTRGPYEKKKNAKTSVKKAVLQDSFKNSQKKHQHVRNARRNQTITLVGENHALLLTIKGILG